METKVFAAVALNTEYETFIVYMTFLNFALLTNANVNLSYKSQMIGLIAKEALMEVFTKYVNFVDIFFLDLVFKLSKHTRINNHTIKLENSN